MKKNFLILFSMLISGFAFAQSADFVTELISAKQVTYGQVCYLVAVYKNYVTDDASQQKAIETLQDTGCVSIDVQPESEVTYQQVAGLFATLWDIKGGLFFRLSKGSPRYAFKQFKTDGIIPSKVDPNMLPTGIDILNMYTLGNHEYADFKDVSENDSEEQTNS